MTVPRVVMMTRVPEYGRVKTRLAKHLGKAQALKAHVQLLSTNVEVAASDASLRLSKGSMPFELHFAGDERRAYFARLARNSGALLVRQVDGDIGMRMLAAARTTPGPCLIIGSDCGALSADYLAEAALALTQAEAVMGRAEDGGYVLIGMREPRPELFEGVDWGTDRVAEQTAERARSSGIELAELALQWDVDTVEDWRRFLKSQRQL